MTSCLRNDDFMLGNAVPELGNVVPEHGNAVLTREVGVVMRKVGVVRMSALRRRAGLARKPNRANLIA